MGSQSGQGVQSVGTCWFCLSNNKADKSLVVSIGEVASICT